MASAPVIEQPAAIAVAALNTAILAEKALGFKYNDETLAHARATAAEARVALTQAGVDAEMAWKVLL